MEDEGKRIEFPTSDKDVVIQFTDDQFFRILRNEVVISGSVTVDATRDPPTIDIRHVTGPFAGQVSRGIFRIEGDRLLMASTPAGADARPERFESRPGDGVLLNTFERIK